MVALKAAEVEPFVARPRADRPIMLLYGPDGGLVRERAQRLIETSVDDPNDPFALVRIEGDVLASEPSRLVEEAHTVPLFGGRRAVWIKTGSRSFAAAVEAVVASPPIDCRIVIEAGDLKRNAPLRALCEKAKCAVALPCYPDDEVALARLIDDEMRAANLSIERDARDALVSLIGGDRQASRSEIRKLALYAHGKNRVVLDDVLAVVADASSMALDAVVDAAFTGHAAETEAQLSKAFSAGTSGGSILSAALRHVAQLHKARVALDASEDNFGAMRSFIPPVHFSRRGAVEAALRLWSAPRLERSMEQLADATFNARRTAALADALAQRSMLAIAQTGRRKNS
jgi:DNA polymerase-3 subunit delta